MSNFLEENGLDIYTQEIRARLALMRKGVPGGIASLDETGKIPNSQLAETDPTVPAWAKADNKPTYTAVEVGAIPSTLKGANNGVAELNADGKVPISQLPSFVSGIEEFADLTVFPVAGESNTIYVALDTNKKYRWSGTQYIEVPESIALGETSSTAYRGDKGKIAYDDSQANKTNIGDLSNLLTQEQSTLVGAINELQSAKKGHVIMDEDDTQYTQRTNLKFINAKITDDSTNDVSEILIKGGNFVGTAAEWGALTLAERMKYDTVDISDDYTQFGIDSVPTDNSQNLVTSGGVKAYVDDLVDTAITQVLNTGY